MALDSADQATDVMTDLFVTSSLTWPAKPPMAEGVLFSYLVVQLLQWTVKSVLLPEAQLQAKVAGCCCCLLGEHRLDQ